MFSEDWWKPTGSIGTGVVYLTFSVFCPIASGKDAPKLKEVTQPKITFCDCPQDLPENPYSHPVPIRSANQFGTSGTSGNNGVSYVISGSTFVVSGQ